jgi:UDP-glucose 4-epimerase
LRYFNVAGAGALNLGDTTTSNLVPTILRALDEGRRPQIFGGDYPTRDGSCIRDYIHVEDVARAHVCAVGHLERHDASTNAVYNVGRGIGVSVREVLAAVRDTTGHPCEADIAPRRRGDAAMLIADVAAIEHALGWRARCDLTEMIHSAWASWCTSTACAGRS